MRLRRFCLLLLLLLTTCLLQSCGSGKSDTTGALSVAGTIADNKDGSYTVTFTPTYLPPDGKTAQGVVVNYKWYENGILVPLSNNSATLTSLSNSFSIYKGVTQTAGSSTEVAFTANIGDMVSTASVIVPALPPVTGTAIGFTSTAVAGDSKTSTVSGGVSPYTVDASTADLNISIAGTTVTVTLLKAPTAGVKSHTIIVTDSQGHTGGIPVTYF